MTDERVKEWRWLRHPKTTQERRANQDRNGGYHRPRRRKQNVPCAYDDIHVSCLDDKCWKRWRKTQYYPVDM